MSPHPVIATRPLCHIALSGLFALVATATALASSPSSGQRPLTGTYWSAIELAGKPMPAQDSNRDAHLVFEKGRVSGSDGCNRVTASYDLKGEVVKFGQIAGTLMACMDTGGTEGAFRDALKAAAKLTIVEDRLELFDQAGRKVAVFAARVKAKESGAAGLAGR